MTAPERLEGLQHWMLMAIATDASHEANQRLLPSQQQTVEQRLAVYQTAYVARLVECLRELFPVLTSSLGREEFDAFAAAYVRQYPPASYTLNRLADRFVDYLTETRPDVPAPGWPDFLIELARLELTIDEVFDGPGSEDLPPLDLRQVIERPAEALLGLRFVPVPCLRLLTFTFPVNDYYTAGRRGEALAWPRPQTTYLAVTRRDYIVRRIPLDKAEYAVLEKLAAGSTLAEAFATVTETITPEQVQLWFADWGRLRLFQSCRA